MYLVDPKLHLVPLGVVGEMVAGDGVDARGYLGQPALTALKFVPDPFSSKAGGRLYRTGDLGRFQEDGTIQMLGRADTQVKIRGFRIELGEIETLLRSHPHVKDAVADPRELTSSGASVVAYVVPVSQAVENGLTAQLQAYIKLHVPDYMRPAVYVTLPEIPLTHSGKVNRRALPTPQLTAAAPIPPRNGVERSLFQIWSDVLGNDAFGVCDDFFQLGGHSLLTLQLMARIRATMDVQLPVASLFEAGTIEAQTRLIQDHGGQVPYQPLVKLNGQTGVPLFLVHPAGGSATPLSPLAQTLDRPLYAFVSQGLERGEEPQASIEEMARTYTNALEEIYAEGPIFLGGWSFGGAVAYEMVHLLQQRGRCVVQLFLLDSYAPIGDHVFCGEAQEALLEAFGRDLALLHDGDLQVPQKSDGTVDESAFFANATQLTGLPADALTAAFRVFSANLTALDRYRPEANAIPALLFRASDAPDQDTVSSDLGWQTLIPGCQILQTPGTHFTMMTPPLVSQLSQSLVKALAAIEFDAPDR